MVSRSIFALLSFGFVASFGCGDDDGTDTTDSAVEQDASNDDAAEEEDASEEDATGGEDAATDDASEELTCESACAHAAEVCPGAFTSEECESGCEISPPSVAECVNEATDCSSLQACQGS